MIADRGETVKTLSETVWGDVKAFAESYARVLPDARFAATLGQLLGGLLAARSPHLAKAAAHVGDRSKTPWARTKRFYRLMASPRFSHREWLRPLYADARDVVQRAGPRRVVVALDGVNLENPYARKLEGISRVRKSTPPGSLTDRPARITYGYPAIVAQVVNLGEPAIPYARLFSYRSPDFVSENRELMRALRTIRMVLSGATVCIVADAGLDDRKLFSYADRCRLEFVIRASHDRWVEVYNPRLQRWELEKLKALAATLPQSFHFDTRFTHAGRTTRVQVSLNWMQIRIPESDLVLWAVVSEGGPSSEPLILLTNRPLDTVEQAKQVYEDWRRRPTIEHLYRFIQEEGLDIEKIRLRQLERRRRVFILILVAALYVLRLPQAWSPVAVSWLRELGSGLAGTAMDRDGFYVILTGLQAVLIAVAVMEALETVPARLRRATTTAQLSYG